MKPLTYLIIDLACVIVPLSASFYVKCSFYKQWKYFFPVNFVVAFIFLFWDYWFTKWGVWGFNPDYLTGIYLFNLPIEEVLFFICIPYACVFTYFICNKYIKLAIFDSLGNVPVYLLIVLCLMVSFFHFDKKYTFTTAILLLVTLLFTLLKKVNIKMIVFSYLIILPFFLLSNGILTGSFLDHPIVWYNEDENLGVRMFTIPIEDTFYGLLLILWNVLGYETIRRQMIKNPK